MLCTSVSDDARNIDDETKKCTAIDDKDNIVPFLKQIIEQQNIIQLHQNRLQQQLTSYKALHEQQHLNLLQHMKKFQADLSEKVHEMEMGLASLHRSLAECVRESLHSESVEMVSIMTETICNHMLDELRNTSFGGAGGVSKTQLKTEKKSELKTAQVKSCHETAGDNGNVDDVSSYDSEVGGRKDKDDFPGKQGEKRHEKMSGNDTSDFLKNIIHYELNSFLVNIQKCLLKPTTSEDVSAHIISSIKTLLQYERNVMADQLLNVQTVISDDINTRIYQREMMMKQELERIKLVPAEFEKLKAEVFTILEGVRELKISLCPEFSTRETLLQKRDSQDSELHKMNEAEDLRATKHSYEQNPAISGQSKGDRHSKNNDDHTKACHADVSLEQVQETMLIMSVYVLMLLMYHDRISSKWFGLKSSKTAEVNFNPTAGTTFFSQSDAGPGISKEKSAESEHEWYEENIEAGTKHFTEDHQRFMFGENKEARYLCKLNYAEIAEGKEVPLQLDNISPGYILNLRAYSSEKKNNLNLSVQSVSGPHDDRLAWPAEFIITIMLVDQRPLASAREDQWNSFTKTKVIFKPLKHIGRSTPVPVCYFRDDIVRRYSYEDSLQLKVSVRYMGESAPDMEPPGKEN